MSEANDTVAGFRFIRIEEFDDGEILRISLNRPAKRNAQNRGLLVELDEAMARAEARDDVRVVILAAVGDDFSAGHDLGSSDLLKEREPGPLQHETYRSYGGTRPGMEARFRQEWHFFFQNTLRWRNLRKITIAQVQGRTLSAGLMLMWACDLIVAAEDASFADVVSTRLGMCGVEYFAHPWELGVRRTKELLLTGDALSAREAYAIGMVNRLADPVELADATLAFARRIATVPTMAAMLVKESANQAQDIMGFTNSLNACFSLHQTNHAYWAHLNADDSVLGGPANGLPDWSSTGPPMMRGD